MSSRNLFLLAILSLEFPSLTNTPALLHSMNKQTSFKQGQSSENVTSLLKRVQSADPGSPDIDKDEMGVSWGHELFTAGGISLSSSLTSWQDIGSVETAFMLVAAAIKTCQEACLMCANAGTPKTAGYISDVYLEKILESIETCWVGTGGVRFHFSLSFLLLFDQFTQVLSSQLHVPVLPTTPPQTRGPANPTTPPQSGGSAIPTTPPSYRDVACSPPPPPGGLKIKIKRPSDNVATSTLEVPTEATSAAANTEPPAASDEVHQFLAAQHTNSCRL